jgi:hypothetical protein
MANRTLTKLRCHRNRWRSSRVRIRCTFQASMERLACSSLRCRQVPRRWAGITRPERLFGIVLSGFMEFETSDGAVHRLSPGEVVLVEDTQGKGHITRCSHGVTVAFIAAPAEISLRVRDGLADGKRCQHSMLTPKLSTWCQPRPNTSRVGRRDSYFGVTPKTIKMSMYNNLKCCLLTL